MALLFRRMVVVGVGLIGGSLALDARKHGLAGEIIGVGRGQANLRFAQRQGVIDRYVTTETDIPEDTDLLMMATPVQTTVSLTKTFLPVLRPGCIVSDVGSVKAGDCSGNGKTTADHYSFVAGHPIAGGNSGRPRGEGRPFCGSSLHFDADQEHRFGGVEESRLAVA